MVSGAAEILTVGVVEVTVTVTLSVAVPPGPVAVIVYVVVSVGETAMDPLTSTLPTPGSITQVSACVELQNRVDDSPNKIVSGSAERLTLGGWITVTVTPAVAEPPGPVTVMVYVVVSVGEIETDPFTGTVPTPWSMAAESALVEFHSSVADSPSEMVTGSAERLKVGG